MFLNCRDDEMGGEEDSDGDDDEEGMFDNNDEV